MCSTFKYKNVMGRNFDYENSYDEELRIINKNDFGTYYDVVGMCTGYVKEYPLMYDGMNENGLCCSALAFVGNAYYKKPYSVGYGEIPSYDFVFNILSYYRNVREVKEALDFITITDECYSDDFPNTPLHWFVCDNEQSIIIEQTIHGLQYYDGEVMTNNPPYIFMEHIYNSKEVENLGIKIPFGSKYYSRGGETFRLNGDYTSEGRFFRLSYLKDRLEKFDKFDNVISGFHLLNSIEQVYGVASVEDKFEYTIYSVIYDMINLNVYLRFYDDLEMKKFEI